MTMKFKLMKNISSTGLFLKLLFLVLVLTGSSIAQVDKNGGSIYSIFGLGDLSYSSSNRTDGMGIMGIALYGDYTNSNNPAAWTRIPTTIFTSGQSFLIISEIS